MKVAITIKNARKKYDGVTVIPDLSMEIKEGELFTLLGASGCGKTTLLRMIAGFESIESGDFFFNETRINNLPPAKRNIGMVFQNYAIFQHMTVRQNVEFGLKNRKLPQAEINDTVENFLELMHISHLKDRMPHKLSGGQQQRVSIARALAISPDVLLMDEPLSNLDAKLRVEMREVIKDIQTQLGITTIYVTHDQEEAMSISDRIAIMDDGKIQQIGTPRQLYQHPENIFVANFVGKTNIMSAKLEGTKLFFQDGYCTEIPSRPALCNGDVKISVRPEDFIIKSNSETETGIQATVTRDVFQGHMTQYFMTLPSGEQIQTIRESSFNEELHIGDVVKLDIKPEKINIFQNDKNIESYCTEKYGGENE